MLRICKLFGLSFLLAFFPVFWKYGAFSFPTPAVLEYLWRDSRLWEMIRVVLYAAGAITLLCLLVDAWRHHSGKILARAAGLAVVFGVVMHFLAVFQVVEYLLQPRDFSPLVDAHFVKPETAKISARKPRNLLVLSLESMDLSYLDARGGAEKVLPRLTKLAADNLAFSHYRDGFFQGYTFGSLLSVQSGTSFIPTHLGVTVKATQTVEKLHKILPRALTLSDILAQHGYQLLFVSSSVAEFLHTKDFLLQHSYPAANIFSADFNRDDPDLREAADAEKRLGQDWWGFPDALMLEFLKKKVTAMAAKGRFFAWYSSIDTHYGFCPYLCPARFADNRVNHYAHADDLVADFIAWAQKQPWYADTSIAIFADHATLEKLADSEEDNTGNELYHAFVNVPLAPAKKDRVFNQVDLFPTLLNAAGFDIEGGRLGIGTSLFGQKPTLNEKYGEKLLRRELTRRSRAMEALWE